MSFIINRPKLSIILGLVLLVSFLPGFFFLKFDFSPTSWYQEKDPDLQIVKEFEKTFGNDQKVALLIDFKKEQGVFQKNSLEFLESLTEKLKVYPFVQAVDSLTNTTWNYQVGDELFSENFLPKKKWDNPEFLLQRSKEIPNYIEKRFLDEESRYSMLILSLQYHPKKAFDYTPLAEKLEVLRDSYKEQGIDIYLLGGPIVSHRFQYLSFVDFFTLVPMVIVLLSCYLWFTYRSLIVVILPMGATVASLLLTIGSMGYLGFKANSLTFVVPSTLLAIAIADSVHLLNTFFYHYRHGKNKIESARASLMKNLGPVFFTSLSTSVGFFSLGMSEIVPVQDLGILAGIGTMAAFLFSLLWVLPLLCLSKKELNVHKSKTHYFSQETLGRYLKFLESKRMPLLFVFFLMFLGFIKLASYNQIDSNPFTFFKEQDPMTIANDKALAVMKAVSGPEVVVKLKEKLSAQKFQEISLLEREIQTHPRVTTTYSLYEPLLEVTELLSGEKSPPSDNEMLSQVMLFYSMGLPPHQSMQNFIDYSETKYRFNVLWDIQSSKESLEGVSWIKEKAKAMGLDIWVTGKRLLFQKMNQMIVSTFFKSGVVALSIITLMMFLIFKNLQVSLLSVVPNIFPIIIGAGFLPVIGTTVDLGMAIVASVTLGIAVDDTIHFLSHYLKLKKQGHSNYEACLEVLYTTGQALIVTTILLVLAFGFFIFAHLYPDIHFGLMSALVIAIALICDLVVLPTLLLKKVKS